MQFPAQCGFQTSHKEEANTRILSDKHDREEIKTCILPLKPEVHPQTLVNVENGTLAVPEVNVVLALAMTSYLSLKSLCLLDSGKP